ncbi:VOC family protein [Cellulomonas edaphi]|uniref:VOC family protein n=1 Tax=Cellulomonas edaphi TaxID=3053468 RepID=A0ABT7S778_9CELL|nr:VOC family protein [Cellulomons edaphi]MDM7831476.1 VOC family protein [Cellulomons edaphi]
MGLVVSHITFDCADPNALAGWWAQVLGWERVWELDPADEEVALRSPDAMGTWLFIKVPDRKSSKNRVHPDLRPPNGSDQATELARLLELGATPVDIGQGDVQWHVLADPEGNEFCLLVRTPAQVADDGD